MFRFHMPRVIFSPGWCYNHVKKGTKPLCIFYEIYEFIWLLKQITYFRECRWWTSAPTIYYNMQLRSVSIVTINTRENRSEYIINNRLIIWEPVADMHKWWLWRIKPITSMIFINYFTSTVHCTSLKYSYHICIWKSMIRFYASKLTDRSGEMTQWARI